MQKKKVYPFLCLKSSFHFSVLFDTAMFCLMSITFFLLQNLTDERKEVLFDGELFLWDMEMKQGGKKKK